MSGSIADLESEWRKDAARFSPVFAADIFSDLVSRHGEPHRRYHGPSRLAALLDLLAPHVQPGSAVRLAIWRHDAVRQKYDFVADAAFNAGRGAFLARARSWPRLFRKDAFEAAYADQARANMSRERARLAGEAF